MPWNIHVFTQPQQTDSHSCPPQKLKLSQKSQVIFKKKTNVGNPIAQHGHPFHTHAKGKTAHLLWVIAHGTENSRVHHACAQNFKPTRILAHPTSRAFAQKT